MLPSKPLAALLLGLAALCGILAFWPTPASRETVPSVALSAAPAVGRVLPPPSLAPKRGPKPWLKAHPPDPRTEQQKLLAACTRADGSWACKKPRPVTFGATQQALGSSPALTVTDWYVDDSNVTGCALDSNTCTSGTCGSTGIGPCATFNAIVNRWGSYTPIINTSSFFTAIHVLSSWANSAADLVNIDPVGQSMLFEGPLGAGQQVATGTMSGVVQKSTSAGTLLQATLAAGLAVDQYVCNTTHTSCAWTVSLASGTTWNLSQPMNTSFSEVNTWTNGDAYTVYVPATIQIGKAGYLTDFENLTMGSGVANSIYGANFYEGVLFSGGQAVVITYNGTLSQTELLNCDLSTSTMITQGEGALVTAINAGVSRTSNNIQGSFSLGNDFVSAGLQTILLDGSSILDAWAISSSVKVIGLATIPQTYYLAGNSPIYVLGKGQLLYSTVGGWTASQTFLSTAASPLRLDNLLVGCATDLTGDPVIIHCGRSLLPSLLDATVAAGGFGGVATQPGGASIANYTFP